MLDSLKRNVTMQAGRAGRAAKTASFFVFFFFFFCGLGWSSRWIVRKRGGCEIYYVKLFLFQVLQRGISSDGQI